jgi:hypothetical protein
LIRHIHFKAFDTFQAVHITVDSVALFVLNALPALTALWPGFKPCGFFPVKTVEIIQRITASKAAHFFPFFLLPNGFAFRSFRLVGFWIAPIILGFDIFTPPKP